MARNALSESRESQRMGGQTAACTTVPAAAPELPAAKRISASSWSYAKESTSML